MDLGECSAVIAINDIISARIRGVHGKSVSGKSTPLFISALLGRRSYPWKRTSLVSMAVIKTNGDTFTNPVRDKAC